jgi:hypothetical protein
MVAVIAIPTVADVRGGFREREHNENNADECQAIDEDRADTGPDRKPWLYLSFSV